MATALRGHVNRSGRRNHAHAKPWAWHPPRVLFSGKSIALAPLSGNYRWPSENDHAGGFAPPSPGTLRRSRPRSRGGGSGVRRQRPLLSVRGVGAHAVSEQPGGRRVAAIGAVLRHTGLVRILPVSEGQAVHRPRTPPARLPRVLLRSQLSNHGPADDREIRAPAQRTRGNPRRSLALRTPAPFFES